MLDLLRPFFHGDWEQYGDGLHVAGPAPAEMNLAHWLSDPIHLRTALSRHAESLGNARERKAVASDWTLRYFVTLLPPVVALTTLLKYSVPTDLHEMAMTLDSSGAPAAFAISHPGRLLPDADIAVRYNTLVWHHLAPLVAHLARQTKVPSKILWGNARRTLLGIFEQARTLVSASSALSAKLTEDHRQLLETPLWPDGRRNPLFLRHRTVLTSQEKHAPLLTLHASCCLAYRLPGTGHCTACPLTPEYHEHRVMEDSRPTIQRRSASQ